MSEAGFFQKREVRRATGTPESRAKDEQYRKMFLRQTFIDKGVLLERELNLSEAIQLYEKATATNNLTTEQDKTFALIYVAHANVFLENYTAAFATWSEYMRIKPNNDLAIDQKRKVEALIEWQKTGDKQPIYDWIKWMKQKHAQWLPPKDIAFHSTGVMINFIELYDLVGDYDSAIDYIQPFLKRHEAVRNNDYKINEHRALIQALQESKQGMPKICIEDGKVCLGRATAYIIESKSF